MTSKVLNLSEASFDAAVAEGDVLVDFWAEWCGPCLAMISVLESLAEVYEGKVKIVKVDVDKNRALAQRFKVRGLPSLGFMKDGQLVSLKTGIQSRVAVSAFIDSNI